MFTYPTPNEHTLSFLFFFDDKHTLSFLSKMKIETLWEFFLLQINH